MILVLTPEEIVPDEALLAGKMLAAGAALLHIRKFRLQDSALRSYVSEIDACFRDRMVLHSHFHLAGELGISRLHFREADRLSGVYRQFCGHNQCSTSVHTIADFNRLSAAWSHAFLSPVFPSISKPGYGAGVAVLQDLRARQNAEVKLIGLGGVDSTNFKQVLNAGADGVALLGGIWLQREPLNVLQQCLINDL